MDQWKVLCTVNNRIEAEILKGYLESQGIRVFMQEESAGTIYWLSSGPLAEVDLLVSQEQYKEAERVLEVYEKDEV